MRKINILIIIIFLYPSLVFSSNIDKYTNRFKLGLQYSYRYMGYQYGTDKLFDASFAQIGILTHLPIYSHLSVELDFFSNLVKQSQHTLLPGATVFSISNYNPNSTDTYKSHATLNGVGLNVYSYYPLLDKIKIYAVFGAYVDVIGINADHLLTNGITANTEDAEKHKIKQQQLSLVPKAGIGLDIQFSPSFKLKSGISFEYSSQLRKNFSIPGQNNYLNFAAKNSTILNIAGYINV